MAIESRVTEGGVVVVTALGELTLAEAPQIRAALHGLAEGDHRKFVVDLTAAPFVDSAALGLLVGLYRRIQPGGRVWVSGAAPVVAKVFEITGLSKLFVLVGTPEEALELAGR